MDTQEILITNARVVITPSHRKTVKKVKVDVQGHLTINNVEELFDTIEPVFADYDQVDIYLTGIEEIDLTCLQLFEHLKVYHTPNGKSISIDSILPDDIKKIIYTTGFGELMISQKFA